MLTTDEITPVVMVLRTLFEESSQKKGLSFIEMLSPFCVFNNIDVPVRTASDQPYRLQKFKLRLFYACDVAQPNMEVLPSLDVSFQVSLWPSRLQEFLVLMDVIKRTSSESFQVHQLSSVGKEWEISLLQPLDVIFPSDFLVAGQALSCFFKLKNCRKRVNAEDNHSSLVPLEMADIKLVHGDGEALFDILSVVSSSPMWWFIEGPGTVRHNFTVDCCEIKLKMTIHNSAHVTAFVHINTFDSALNINSSSTGASTSSANEAGWFDLSVLNDIKVTSDVIGNHSGKML